MLRALALLAFLASWCAGVVSTPTDQVQYTGTGSVATYSVPYLFKQNGDLVVTENASGTITTEVLGTNYTVAGAGLPSGGSITLTAGNLTSGVVLTIARVPALTQLTSLPNGAPYFGSTIEGALDILCMQGQATQSQAARALQAPLGDSPTTLTLPAASVRANQFVGFDAGGNLTTSALTLGSASVSTFWTPILTYNTAALSLTALGVSSYQQGVLGQTSAGTSRTALGGVPTSVATVAALKALATTNLVGLVHVQGYYAAGDGGGGLYWWNAADTTTDNGGSVIQPGSGGTGRWNLLLIGGIVDIRQFGCYGDGTHDDTTALNAAETFAAAQTTHGCQLHLPPGTFILNATLVLGNGVQLVGSGKRATIISAKSGFTGTYMIQIGPNATQVFDCFLKDLTLQGNSLTGIDGVNMNLAQEGCGLRSVLIDNFMTTGVDASANTSANCFIQECEVYASASASGTVIGIDIHTPDILVQKVTVSCEGTTTVGTHGIRVGNSNATLQTIHCEGYTNGITVTGAGSNSVFGATIDAGTNGAVRPVTTLINDASTGGAPIFVNVVKNAATTTWAQSSYGTTSSEGILTSTIAASAAGKAATTPSVTTGSYQYHNTLSVAEMVTISGGTISAMSVQRGGTTAAIVTSTPFVVLCPGDILNITNSGAPTVTVFPMG